MGSSRCAFNDLKYGTYIPHRLPLSLIVLQQPSHPAMSDLRKIQRDFFEAAQALALHHPLQRWPSFPGSTSLALHAIGLASVTFSFTYLIHIRNHVNLSFGCPGQYLTIISLTLCALTFTLGFLADVTLSPRLFRLKDFFSVASASIVSLVSMLYWGLYLIEPGLVVLPGLGLPLSADLSIHAIPAVLSLIDLLLFSSPTVFPTLAFTSATALGYWFWVEVCHTQNGFYPYPILEMVSTSGRRGLFAGGAVVMSVIVEVLKFEQRRLYVGSTRRLENVEKEQ